MLAQYKKEYTTVKAYQNYIDRTLPNWSSAYYADAWPRLVNIKKSVDPSNIFRNPQSIPVAIWTTYKYISAASIEEHDLVQI